MKRIKNKIIEAIINFFVDPVINNILIYMDLHYMTTFDLCTCSNITYPRMIFAIYIRRTFTLDEYAYICYGLNVPLTFFLQFCY